MNDILDEVQEFQKQEFINKLLSKYGKYIVMVSVLIVVITSVFVYRNHLAKTRQKEYSLVYMEAFSGNNTVKMQAVASQDAEGFSALAKLNLAKRYENQKEYSKAAALYLRLIEGAKHDEIRNFALYRFGIGAYYAKNVHNMQKFISTPIKGEAFKDLVLYVKALTEYLINKNTAKFTELTAPLTKDSAVTAELKQLIAVVESNIKNSK